MHHAIYRWTRRPRSLNTLRARSTKISLIQSYPTPRWRRRKSGSRKNKTITMIRHCKCHTAYITLVLLLFIHFFLIENLVFSFFISVYLRSSFVNRCMIRQSSDPRTFYITCYNKFWFIHDIRMFSKPKLCVWDYQNFHIPSNFISQSAKYWAINAKINRASARLMRNVSMLVTRGVI